MTEQFKEDDIKNNLVGLLEYAKALYEIRSKTFSDYLQPAYIPILNTDLKSYENVFFNEDVQGDAWISIRPYF